MCSKQIFNSILLNSIKIISELLGCGLLENRASSAVLGSRTVVWGVWLVVKEFCTVHTVMGTGVCIGQLKLLYQSKYQSECLLVVQDQFSKSHSRDTGKWKQVGHTSHQLLLNYILEKCYIFSTEFACMKNMWVFSKK